MGKVFGVVVRVLALAIVTSCAKDALIDSGVKLAQKMQTFGQGPGVPFPSTKLFVTTSAEGKSLDFARGEILSEPLAMPSATHLLAGDKTNDIGYPDGLALDLVFDRMYWTDRWTGNLVRAELAGKNYEILQTGLKAPSGIALDLTNNLVFWAERGSTTTNDGTIRCADYRNSSNVVTTLFQGRDVPEAIALALGLRNRATNGNTTTDTYDIYWTESRANTVMKGQIQVKTVKTTTGTGSNQNTSVSVTVTGSSPTTPLYTDPTYATRDVALDLSAKKVYWTTRNEIFTANLDGTNRKSVLTTGIAPNHIALDIPNQNIYYTANQGDDLAAQEDLSRIDGVVHRVKFDGTGDTAFDTKGSARLALALGN